MKNMKKLLALTLCLLLLLGNTLPAIADTVPYHEEIERQLQMATKDITITLTENVTGAINIDTKKDITYTITGKNYTLGSLDICGAGTVIIDVKAIYSTNTFDALVVNETARVTVTGDIIGHDTGDGDATNALSADGNAVVTVTGHVTGGSVTTEESASSGSGIVAVGSASVTVTGNVAGGRAEANGSADAGNGIVADGNATVKVSGDVTGGSAKSLEESARSGSGIDAYWNSRVEVTGNVMAGDALCGNHEDAAAYADSGVYASTEGKEDACPTVIVTGNVSGGNAEGKDAQSGEGVWADCATITVNGDVESGKAEGFYYAGSGDGAYACGDATVTVTGDVKAGDAKAGSEAEDSAYSGDGAYASGDKTTIIVGGNATGGNAEGFSAVAGDGIDANSDSRIEVTGNVTGGNAKGIDSEESYASAGDGIEAAGRRDDEETADVNEETVTTAIVGGKATGGNAEGYDAYAGNGVYAFISTVTANSNVAGGKADGHEASGGYGIDSSETAKIQVTGNVTGGSIKGVEVIFPPHGIHAMGASTITVGGNVTGGDLTLSADEEADDADSSQILNTLLNFTAGHGVTATMASTITVEGDVTGGNALGELGNGGVGMVLNILMADEEEESDGDEEPVVMADPGTVTVSGTVSGGQSKNGKAGVGIYYSVSSDTESMMDIMLSIDLDILYGTLEDYLKTNDSEHAVTQYLVIKALLAALAQEDDAQQEAFSAVITEAIMRDTAAALKIEVPADLDLSDNESAEFKAFDNKLDLALACEIAKDLGITVPADLEKLDPKSAEYTAFMEKIEAAKEENPNAETLTLARMLKASGMKHFDTAVAKSGAPEALKKKIGEVTMPTVKVSRVSTAYGLAVNSLLGNTLLEHLGGDPAIYDVTVKEAKNGTVKADKDAAKAGETITLTVTPAKGYVVDTVKAGSTVLKAKDGVYTVTMVSGGLDITATFKAVVSDSETDSESTKSPDTGEAVAMLPVLLLVMAAAALAISTKRRTA